MSAHRQERRLVSDPTAPSVLVCISGATDDQSWSGAAARGAHLALEGYVEYCVIESLKPDLEGWTMVLGHGAEYAPLLARAAANMPHTTFVVSDDPGPLHRSDLPNISYVDWQWDQGTYLGGVLAARLSQAGMLGYLAGAPVLTQQRALSAFVAGAAAGNPNAAVLAAYAGTFHDAGRGKRLAAGLIAEGADVLCHTADLCGVGAMDAVEEAGKLGIGFMNSGEATRPAVAAFIQSDVEGAVANVLTRLRLGAHLPRVFRFGLSSGFLRFTTSFELVPPDIVDESVALQSAISRGEVPFLGAGG